MGGEGLMCRRFGGVICLLIGEVSGCGLSVASRHVLCVSPVCNNTSSL